MTMLTRRYRTQIEDHLTNAPAVALLGPRQVGKTTLALEIAPVIFFCWVRRRSISWSRPANRWPAASCTWNFP